MKFYFDVYDWPIGRQDNSYWINFMNFINICRIESNTIQKLNSHLLKYNAEIIYECTEVKYPSRMSRVIFKDQESMFAFMLEWA